MFTMLKKIILIICSTILVLFSFCKKKTTTVQDNIPYQTVNINLYPNDPLYFRLQTVGGWMYINGGVNGIIIFRQTMTGATDFVALERTSTYLPNDANAAVKVLSDNFTLKDTVSGSTWQLNNGAVLSGPATLSLRQYQTIYDNGTGVLNIRN